MRNITKNFTLRFALLAVMLIATSSFTSKNLDLKEFKIEFLNTKNGLKLIGLKGTAFKELSFTLKDNVKQGVDAFGMTTQETKENSTDDNLADFEFTIEKVNNEYRLISKKGTSWTKLSFTLRDKTTVDQNGVRTR